ncbi:MAG: restriction endonuclease subunit S [Phycisphaerales bacterium]|nr:restriction endonuclease subunit S [Phycisphaerales bacterium]
MAKVTWTKMTLGDVIELKRGYDLPERDREDGPYPIVSSSGISGRHSKAMAKAPGVVTGRYGTLGVFHYITEDYWPLNTALYVRDFKGNDPRFISYFLRTIDFFAYSDKAAVPGLNRNHLHMAPVTIPDPDTQRAIAGVLGALDDKIEVNRRMARTLEAAARALFESWFVRFEHPATKAPAPRLVDSAVGPIPEGWSVGTLGDLGQVALGGDWGEDVAFDGAINAACLRGVDLEHLRFSGSANAPRRWFKPGSLDRRKMDERDVLIAGSGAGPTGRPLWMHSDLLASLGQCVYSNFCKRIRCGSAAEAVYLDSWLQRMRDSGEIWEHVNGTSVPNLDANSLLSGKEVVIPPADVLERFAAFVRPIWSRLYIGESAALAAMRDALLPKLISGELAVPDALGGVEHHALVSVPYNGSVSRPTQQAPQSNGRPARSKRT